MGQGPSRIEPGSSEGPQAAAARSNSVAILMSDHPRTPRTKVVSKKAHGPMPSSAVGESAGMDAQVRLLAEQLLRTGFDQLAERERRVITGVAQRTRISRDLN